MWGSSERILVLIVFLLPIIAFLALESKHGTIEYYETYTNDGWYYAFMYPVFAVSVLISFHLLVRLFISRDKGLRDQYQTLHKDLMINLNNLKNKIYSCPIISNNTLIIHEKLIQDQLDEIQMIFQSIDDNQLPYSTGIWMKGSIPNSGQVLRLILETRIEQVFDCRKIELIDTPHLAYYADILEAMIPQISRI